MLFFGELQEVLVFVENLASNGFLWIGQTHDDLGGNRLSAARLANQCHALTRTNIKAYMVNNLNVSVRLKADAKIFNAQQWSNIKVWLTSISSGQLNLFKCIKSTLQGLCLLCICTNWIRRKNVICTPGVRVLCIYRSSRCCCHSVSKTLGEDVQCQAGHHNSQAWEECLPPTTSKNASASISQDITPCRSWLCNTSANKGQRCLKDDCVCNKRNGKDHDGSNAVTKNVLPQNPRCTSTRNNGCPYVILAVLAYDVCTNNTRNLWRVHKANSKDN